MINLYVQKTMLNEIQFICPLKINLRTSGLDLTFYLKIDKYLCAYAYFNNNFVIINTNCNQLMVIADD